MIVDVPSVPTVVIVGREAPDGSIAVEDESSSDITLITCPSKFVIVRATTPITYRYAGVF